MVETVLPSEDEMQKLFISRHGRPEHLGWATSRRWKFGYYLPAEIYEAVVSASVFEGCAWIDVGGGHSIFPENPELARALVARCSASVAVDPSENVRRNTYVHHAVQCKVEDYHPEQQFDLATLRMVAEHVVDPKLMVQALHHLLKPGGRAVLLTVNLWSPLTLMSRLTPFFLHHPIKKMLWGSEEEDSFPVQYKLNSRRILRDVFQQSGFRELAFAYLDDLSAFGGFKGLNYLELLAWRLLNRLGLHYPETCLLSVYQKLTER